MGSCSHEHHNALHGVHDHPNVAQRLAEAESLCAASGARLTPLRKEVLELILNASGPMGAYDLLAQMKNASDRPAAPPTVYRTLDFLLEKGFIHRQAAFLICTECKAVKEASAQGLLEQLDALAASDDFSAHHSIIEISGICQQCRNKA